MNREIKFRGKRLDNGKWVYGDLLQSKYSNGDYKASIMEQTPVALNFPVYPKTVGQYTGLEDKNGVEVYEGDIVKCTESFPVKLRKFVSKVFWEGNGFFVKEGTVYCPIDIYDSHPERATLNKMEIIGNIHDNPELLEVKRNE